MDKKTGSRLVRWLGSVKGGRLEDLSPFPFHLSLARGEQGFALILAMLILVAITALGIAAIMTSGVESDMAGNYRRTKVAQVAADACLQTVFAQLNSRDTLTPVSGALPTGQGRFRTPVAADCSVNPGAIGGDHPNAVPFGRPKPPYRDRRSGVFTPGMNIVRSGTGQASSWGYRLYEVECEGWVPDPSAANPAKPDQSLARVVVRGAAGKLGPEGGSWSTEY